MGCWHTWIAPKWLIVRDVAPGSKRQFQAVKKEANDSTVSCRPTKMVGSRILFIEGYMVLGEAWGATMTEISWYAKL